MAQSINKTMKISFIHVLGIVFLFAASSCGDKTDDAGPFIASVGNARLTVDELRAGIPSGVSRDDSVRIARAYIRQWVDSHLISQVAAGEIDMREIDRLTEEYRNNLIMWEYSRQMFDAHGASVIAEDSLRAYYDANREEFRLQRPMVKGVYLKVPDDDKSLSALRRLYRSKKAADIDRLEKSELFRAVHYDYFRDRWVDWEQIENRIPYDFGPDGGSTFLRVRRSLDTSAGGFTYLLDISEMLPAGSVMPYETAKEMIKERINLRRRRAYDITLREELYRSALSSGKLKINVDIGNPLMQLRQ